MRRREKSNLTSKLLVLVILVVFISSLFAITQLGGDDEKVVGDAIEVSGHTFYKQQGAYVTEVAPELVIGFLINPENVTECSIDGYAATLLSSQSKIYITYDPNEEVASYAERSTYDLLNVLIGYYKKDVVRAYTEDSNPIDPNMPLRSCSDAGEVGIIELRLGETGVSVEGDCVVVQGADEVELQIASSKLAMWLAGVKV